MTLALARPDPWAMAADWLLPHATPIPLPAFANDEQETFFDSHAPEILYSGAMGAGKSRILCEKAWAVANTYRGVTVGIFRKVRASLAATTLRTFTRDVMDPALMAGRNLSEGWVDLRNGSRIYFLGLDPDPLTGVPSKVGSLDLACAYVDEAVELAASDWVMLIGRLRDPRIPWHQIGAATNPGPATHWLKARFTPPTERRVYLHTTALENRFLPADYQELIASLAGGTDAATMRLVDGLWVNAEGAIWALPDAQVKAPEQDAWHRRVAGVDWGFQHAFAAEAIGETSTGERAVLGELYERGWTIDDVIPALKAFRAEHEIEEFFADQSQPAYIRQCRDAGLPMMAATNGVLPGLTAVTHSFQAGMTVDPGCVGLIGEIPGYVWKRDRASGNTIDVPVKVNDDACDALRYGVMGLESGGFGAFYRDEITKMRAGREAAA